MTVQISGSRECRDGGGGGGGGRSQIKAGKRKMWAMKYRDMMTRDGLRRDYWFTILKGKVGFNILCETAKG